MARLDEARRGECESRAGWGGSGGGDGGGGGSVGGGGDTISPQWSLICPSAAEISEHLSAVAVNGGSDVTLLASRPCGGKLSHGVTGEDYVRVRFVIVRERRLDCGCVFHRACVYPWLFLMSPFSQQTFWLVIAEIAQVTKNASVLFKFPTK